MTSVAIRPEELRDHIAQALGALARSVTLARGEVTVKSLRDGQGQQTTQSLNAVAAWATTLQS